jgi:hypothetical protein
MATSRLTQQQIEQLIARAVQDAQNALQVQIDVANQRNTGAGGYAE